MTLLIVLILAAILIVIGISVIKKTAKNQLSGKPTSGSQINVSGNIPPAGNTQSGANPGSIPDKTGTKGDGGSALSSGQQG